MSSLPTSPQIAVALAPSTSGLQSRSTTGATGAAHRGDSSDKKTYTKEEWKKLMENTALSKQQMNELVMNYMVIEGYKDAAEKFSKECGITPGLDLNSIKDRMETRKALQSGDVKAAMELTNDLDSGILDNNETLFFHLQQQKLIEMIREGKINEALDFAQNELAPRGEENREFLKELERTMTLLAFEDASKSPMADLLSPSQRQKTASELNAAILSSQCQEKEPKLPALFRMLLWAQDQLKERVVFPAIDVETATLQDVPSSAEDPSPSS